jgi:hypothetical protein
MGDVELNSYELSGVGMEIGTTVSSVSSEEVVVDGSAGESSELCFGGFGSSGMPAGNVVGGP